MTLILTVIGIFAVLVASECWWRTRHPHSEFSRKFIHIVVGSQAAFWPFYLSWNVIVLLGVAFIVVVSISKYFKIFQAIHAVERPTWGEVCFALAVGLLAWIAHQPWIYAVGLLHMSLADGLAAIVGVHYGTSTRYHVFGHTKSLAGSAAFLIVSLGLLSFYSWHVHALAPDLLIGLAIAATALENLGRQGLDNLFVPLLVGAVLRFVA